MLNLRKKYMPLVSQIYIKRNAHRNHYDALGLHTKSSQTEIKEAYYKLSMRYHPDKAEGNEIKFREITSAYEVLGNVKMRRLYDQGAVARGIRNPTADDLSKAKPPPEPAPDPNSRFYRSKAPSTGRTQYYNFDEWSRAHYAKTLNRDFMKMKMKATASETRTRIIDARRSDRNESLIIVALFMIIAFLLSANATVSRSRIDKPTRKPPDDP